MTALGNPELLKQLSRSLAELTRLFARFDRDGNGYVNKEEFFEVYNELFVDDADAAELFDRIDVQHDDRIDYVSFVDRIKLADIPAITKKCRTSGPLKAVRPLLCHPPVPMQRRITLVRSLAGLTAGEASCLCAGDAN